MQIRLDRMCRAFAVAALLATTGIATVAVAQAQAVSTQAVEDAASRQEQLRKLRLEIHALERAQSIPIWVTQGGTLVVGLLVGFLSAWGAWQGAYRGRIAALDKSVHDKRIEVYAGLAAATESLALYFPPVTILSRTHCESMGEALRAWYFQHGGLLMTRGSRDAYFKLARVLTLAARAQAERLAVPNFPADAVMISKELIDTYREALGEALNDVGRWTFGEVSEPKSDVERFRDYVLMQKYSSQLRSELTADIRGRLPPEG